MTADNQFKTETQQFQDVLYTCVVLRKSTTPGREYDRQASQAASLALARERLGRRLTPAQAACLLDMIDDWLRDHG